MSEPVINFTYLTGTVEIKPVKYRIVRFGQGWAIECQYSTLSGFLSQYDAYLAALAAKMTLEDGEVEKISLFPITSQDHELSDTRPRSWAVFMIVYFVMSWVFIIGIIWLLVRAGVW